MTLLETVIAIVILSLAAVGLLELFEGSSRSASDAGTWVTAVAYAEEGVEAARIGPSAEEEFRNRRVIPGFSRDVRVIPSVEGLEDIVVTVSLPGGARYVVHRLARAR